MENDTPQEKGIEFQEVIRIASAAKIYLLEDIRYVYDESKSLFDNPKTSTPSRYCFQSKTTEFEITKEYLNWYIDRFNIFFSKLLTIGKQNDPDKRINCFIAGLTISRLAVDALTILSTDIPLLRKWLINLLTTGKSNSKKDRPKAIEILKKPFFQNQLLPTLKQIPTDPIQKEIITHTERIYEGIENMEMNIKSKGGGRTLTGTDLLWAYRNARHGYAIQEKDQEALLLHSGKIPDDLPDLTISLWHFLLLRFPFGIY